MTARFPPIHLGAPGEEISKKDLFAVAQRFKLFNQSRLQRVREFLQPRQHDFLHLLPLLFHINHPLLPGFVSLDTPAGVPDYTPNKQTVDTAKQFSKGFVYKRKALKNYPIHSIFLMGSVGSMAFSKDSDIDIWLCHQPELSPAERDELRQKAELIEKWAASLKLEVHFFLVNSQQFKKGENTPISAESSGETQHYLLLEEFYRTAIYIAGRVPVWWLVPPEQERRYSEYVAHLLENRFISEVDVLDFGGLQDMPMAEFVSATLWHIYKSLNSPHKSLLKLFLMESYAAEFPEPRWLCLALKHAIYSGDFSVDSLDPYLMIYRKVEDYLQQFGSIRRRDLARESFHIKIMGSSAKALDGKARMLHENFLAMIAQRFHWPDDLLSNLDSQKFWDIKRANNEHAVIRDQLQQCLRIILKIAGGPTEHNLQENNDIKLLSRKLRASLDSRPGKIEVLTTRTMVQAKPEVVSLMEVTETNSGTQWYLFTGKLPGSPIAKENAIKHGENLLELLCWMVVNGLYQKGMNLQVSVQTQTVTLSDLNRLLAELHSFFGHYLRAKETGLDVYAQPNRSLSSLLLVNWGKSLPIDVNPEQFVMSERSDPLSYGEGRHCFIQDVQKLSVSSWGEVTLQHFTGLEGFFNCVTESFNQNNEPIGGETFQVVCLTRGRGKSIELRIEQIYSRLRQCFSSRAEPVDTRYLLPGEAGFCCFKSKNSALSYYFLENNNQLLQELASTQSVFSPVVFDEYVLEQTFIPFLYRHNVSGAVQIFYHTTSKHVAVYVIDEKGSLFVRQHVGANAQHILVHYVVFLRTLLLQGKLTEDLTIQCLEIQKNSAGVTSCQPVQVKPNSSALELRVRIVADESLQQAIYCNERRFEITDSQSFRTVKEHILVYRKQREDYPFHITEIDVPTRLLGIDYAEQAQSVHYLNYKQKIEEKLNI